MIRYLRPPSPIATHAVTWHERLRRRATEAFHRLLNRLGLPGAVAPMTFRDEVTGCTLTVRVGVYSTILTVDGRDYYFHRLTGTFDGTGQAV